MIKKLINKIKNLITIRQDLNGLECTKCYSEMFNTGLDGWYCERCGFNPVTEKQLLAWDFDRAVLKLLDQDNISQKTAHYLIRLNPYV